MLRWLPFVLLSSIGNVALGQDALPAWPRHDEYVAVDFQANPVNYKEIRSYFEQNMARTQTCMEGRIIVKVLFDEYGRYVQHVVLKSDHALLDRALEQELPCILITPPYIKDTPIPYWHPFLFRYRCPQ